MTQQRFGLIGLGVMGHNLALNLSDSGVALTCYSYSETERNEIAQAFPQLEIAESLQDMLKALGERRVVFLMVTAGDAIDQVLAELMPHLSQGDVVIDGGNSNYLDTERRAAACAQENVNFIGVGISGGAEGARHGASVMIGGDQTSFTIAEPMFSAMACEVGDDACYGWLGQGGAGHFVKTVQTALNTASCS